MDARGSAPRAPGTQWGCFVGLAIVALMAAIFVLNAVVHL